jgi:hypothetical protein
MRRSGYLLWSYDHVMFPPDPVTAPPAPWSFVPWQEVRRHEWLLPHWTGGCQHHMPVNDGAMGDWEGGQGAMWRGGGDRRREEEDRVEAVGAFIGEVGHVWDVLVLCMMNSARQGGTPHPCRWVCTTLTRSGSGWQLKELVHKLPDLQGHQQPGSHGPWRQQRRWLVVGVVSSM